MHARRLSRRREPGLERDERRSLTRVGGITVFSEPTARAVGVHAMPAWKLMLGRDAPLQVMVEHGTEEGWALLVPPGLANSAVARGAYTAVLIDPGYARGESTDGVVDLGRRRARHLVEELDAGHWTGLPTGTNDVLTEDESFLGVVLRETTSATTIERLSSRLGVSRQHARRLIRVHTGCTFGEIVRWRRLCDAVLLLPRAPIAVAASQTGFADQAHLTRTSSAMVGRTPGTL